MASKPRVQPILPAMEPLEGRELLSTSHGLCGSGSLGGFGGLPLPPIMGGPGGVSGNTIQFSQAPAAVQSGLDTLATADNLTAPTATQAVFLGNSNGKETYTVDISGTGINAALTVDVNGNPITAPTKTTTTFGAITNTAATTEISAIATALDLTAPASTTNVNSVTTGSTTVYTITLTASTGKHPRSTSFSVDSNGNPTGNIVLPFSAMLPAVQNGLNANAPTGATALSSTSMQSVTVATLNGVTTYSTTFITTGTRTKVTVDATGALANLPSSTTTTFSNLPAAAQTEIQTLATADGVSGTISANQSVLEYNEANGIILYSVKLKGANSAGTTINVRITVDQNGDPTTLPKNKSKLRATILDYFFWR